MLAKRMSSKGDHALAARMLIRIARNISQFPAHTVPILTSTVITCQRAGLKKSSFEFASILMKPEYRNQIDAKYRKPIEAFVRRPVESEIEESVSPCPFCDIDLPETQLSCHNCKNQIPYCAQTGKHMVADDWSKCPQCQITSLYSILLEKCIGGEQCLMCNMKSDSTQIIKIKDVKSQLVKKSADETELEQRNQSKKQNSNTNPISLAMKEEKDEHSPIFNQNDQQKKQPAVRNAVDIEVRL